MPAVISSHLLPKPLLRLRVCRMTRIRRGAPPLFLLLLAAAAAALQLAQGFVPPSVKSSSATSSTSGGQSRRRAPVRSSSSSSSTAASTAAPAPPDVPFTMPEDTPIFQVPAALRRPPQDALSPEPAQRIQFLSLESLFPGPDGGRLAKGFDIDGRFRREIRVAMRDDLFVPDPTRSMKANNYLKDLGSSLHVTWERSPTDYGNLTQLFRDYGFKEIDGPTFIKTLGGLAGGGARVKDADGFELHEKRFGSLIDIVNPGNRLKPAHSWHLDANLPQTTVMFGFPRANSYRGAGVFSHAVQLSHQLRDQVPGGGQVVQWDEFEGVDRTFPEEVIIRPWYERGMEVMVYDDSWSIHSAPDHIHREAVWRFM